MIAFEKENKLSNQSTNLSESRSCQRETVKLYIESLVRTVELRHLKLFLSLMNTLRNNCPQKIVRGELHKKESIEDLQLKKRLE